MTASLSPSQNERATNRRCAKKQCGWWPKLLNRVSYLLGCVLQRVRASTLVFPRSPHSQSSSFLRALPIRTDNYALSPHSIKYRIRRSPDNQLANTRLRSGAAQVRVQPQSLHHRNDSCGQLSCSSGFVQRHEGMNLSQPCPRQRRPNDLYRYSASSSCSFPQAHFGGGNSCSVPQESSHAFMSSCLT